MSRILYIDPIGGVAGDMLCAALLDAGLNEQKWRYTLDSLMWSEDVEIVRSQVMRGVFAASHINIRPELDALSSQDKQSQTVHHNHNIGHGGHGGHGGHVHGSHSHTHTSVSPLVNQPTLHNNSTIYTNGPQPTPWSNHHRGFTDISDLISASPLPAKVQDMAIQVFRVLGEAEATIHGSTLEDIHFHEVGAVDSILDIVGFCLGVHMLKIDTILAGSVPLSSGQIHTAHGPTPLPAPATLRILHGWPTVQGHPNHEQVTPTGAAILKTLAIHSSFPSMTPLADGYGAGTRNPTAYANLLRVCIGTTIGKETTIDRHTVDEIIEIQANIDDMSAELLSPLLDHLLSSGAVDATLTPILMKKGRVGHLCTILTTSEHKESVLKTLFTHSTTFGCRFSHKQRAILDRTWDTVKCHLGTARVKIGYLGNTVHQISIEFEDALALATEHDKSLTEVIPLIQHAHQTQFPTRYNTGTIA